MSQETDRRFKGQCVYSKPIMTRAQKRVAKASDNRRIANERNNLSGQCVCATAISFIAPSGCLGLNKDLYKHALVCTWQFCYLLCGMLLTDSLGSHLMVWNTRITCNQTGTNLIEIRHHRVSGYETLILRSFENEAGFVCCIVIRIAVVCMSHKP